MSTQIVSSSQLPQNDEMVEVRMSKGAAEMLALACKWAVPYAIKVWDDDMLDGEQRRQAMIVYEWLDWGSRWLVK